MLFAMIFLRIGLGSNKMISSPRKITDIFHKKLWQKLVILLLITTIKC